MLWKYNTQHSESFCFPFEVLTPAQVASQCLHRYGQTGAVCEGFNSSFLILAAPLWKTATSLSAIRVLYFE